MKKHIALLIFIFFLFLSFAFAQTYSWQVLNPASISGTPDFSDLYFTVSDTGWITSSSQANIYKTVDGAVSFSTQTTPLGATSAIYMLDADNGYSGGQGGWIYKTSDGGLNWNILGSMGTCLAMSFPFGTDLNNPIGYASGNSGNVWEITSILTNLNSPSSSTFSGISAPSANNVWVCGGGRIYYYNGADFTSQSTPGGTFIDIHFINNPEGWVVGDAGVIGKTSNGGMEWVTLDNPDSQDRSLYGVFFLDSNNGWAVGADGIILHTIDGGSNWVIEGEGLTTSFLRGVHFTSPTNGYIVGIDKTLLKYGELTGNNEVTKTLRFEIYPNPAGKKFGVRSLEFGVNGGILEIYDLNGRKLLEKHIPKGSETIKVDVSSLQSGVNFCRLISENKSSTQKIIIQK
ncbi:MAG: hypothetical protein CVU43_17570 [Chloroflexi bacterium HGW-Chloroflexi-5]|jgi:photosystem II stability/assembly factor-like uncharacterized protein|nr:MAG: hypothetical protein CVU43_17570 [Chloroflexi bacterium HGW-Chloroflexi-5]